MKGHEIAILIILIENQFIEEESLSIWTLRGEMKKAGYTDVATSVGVRTLVKKGLIQTFMEIDRMGDGEQLRFRQEDKESNNDLKDELPF